MELCGFIKLLSSESSENPGSQRSSSVYEGSIGQNVAYQTNAIITTFCRSLQGHS